MKHAIALVLAASLVSSPRCVASASGLPMSSIGISEQAPPPAVPRPFPGTGPAKTPDPPGQPPGGPPVGAPVVSAPTPAADPVPGGVPVYPTAEFIDSFDAGSGQRYYLYGTNAPYADIVTYYRTVLKNGGRELYRTPPMQQFDLGRFEEDAMAYPPSVVVKDYTWNGAKGYLSVSGTTEKRFRTVIQIVPAGAVR